MADCRTSRRSSSERMAFSPRTTCAICWPGAEQLGRRGIALNLSHEEDEIVFAEPGAVRLHQRGTRAQRSFFHHFLGTTGQVGAGDPLGGKRDQVLPFPREGEIKKHTYHAIVVVFHADLRLLLSGELRVFDHRRALKEELLRGGVL